MSKRNYYYNPETCQFEPVGIRFGRILFYALGLVVTGGLLCIGILFLHARLITTDQELALRSENKALVKYHDVITEELETVNETIAELHKKDASLQAMIFEEQQATSADEPASLKRQDVILAEASTFNTILNLFKSKSEKIAETSELRNRVYSHQLKINSEELKKLQAMPSRMPVVLSEETKFVSGFGSRVNPYHKGMYHHPGADFAAPRGTLVLVTGAGRITDINRSSTQAGYGNYVEVDHGYGIVTRYAHLDDITVRIGQKVKKGDVLGTVGMSGGSIAPHVHYEVIRDGEQVDPVMYMMEGLSTTAYAELIKLGNKKNQSLD